MTLIKWNPMHSAATWRPVTSLADELLTMQRAIDHMFDNFRCGASEPSGVTSWQPAVDIIEKESSYVVTVDLPGVKKNDVKITIKDNTLTIQGVRSFEHKEKDGGFQRIERSYGTFQRSFTLPATVKSEAIEASFEDGILSVILPEVEEPKLKAIEIKVK